MDIEELQEVIQAIPDHENPKLRIRINDCIVNVMGISLEQNWGDEEGTFLTFSHDKRTDDQ